MERDPEMFKRLLNSVRAQPGGLRSLANRTGVSYSYVHKLACGFKNVEQVSDVYYKTLMDELERTVGAEFGGEKHVS